MIHSLVAIPGGWELVLIVLVILLLFGAKKLPELARGSGRALRIFKAETKGLVDDDEKAEEERARHERELGTGQGSGPIVPPTHPTTSEPTGESNRPEHDR